VTTKTYEDLITEAREFAQDSLAPFRNEDSFYLNHLNRGLQEIGRMRPDAFYELFDANELNIPNVVDDEDAETPDVDWGTAFQIDGMFYAPLLAYVQGAAEVQDDEFTVDGRAAMLLAHFRNTVLGL
jgi:hypothetical protein